MGLTDSKIAERMGKTRAAVKHYSQRHVTDIKIEDSKEVPTEADVPQSTPILMRFNELSA